MLKKIKNKYNDYPNPFKVLVFATFIDMLGSFLLYSFFALYITERFEVGMIEVGILFSVFSLGNILGGVLGGALTDKYGRKFVILIGLIFSGVGSIFMGLVDDLLVFIWTFFFYDLLTLSFRFWYVWFYLTSLFVFYSNGYNYYRRNDH